MSNLSLLFTSCIHPGRLAKLVCLSLTATFAFAHVRSMPKSIARVTKAQQQDVFVHETVLEEVLQDNTTYRLNIVLDFLQLYESTPVPALNMDLGTYLRQFGIDPFQDTITIRQQETTTERLLRYGFNSYGFSINSKDAFKKTILATLESYARIHSDGRTNDELVNTNLSSDERLIFQLFETGIFSDPITNGSNNKGVIDGSTIAATAFAPLETSNQTYLISRDSLLNHLGLILAEAKPSIANPNSPVPENATLTGNILRTTIAAYLDLTLMGINLSGRLTFFRGRDTTSASAPIYLPGQWLNLKNISFYDTKGVSILAERLGITATSYIRTRELFNALQTLRLIPIFNLPPETRIDPVRNAVMEDLFNMDRVTVPPFTPGSLTRKFDSNIKAILRNDLEMMIGSAKFPGYLGDDNAGQNATKAYLNDLLFREYRRPSTRRNGSNRQATRNIGTVNIPFPHYQ